jgi:benzoate membrane transport protein
MRFRQDFSVSALVAGLVVVLVGYTSTVSLVIQAAQAVGANSAQIASWMWALGIGMGLSCIALSLYAKQPIITAWSTPGAALIASTQGIDLAHATGAFIASGVLIAIAGFSGLFERVLAKVPMTLANAMLAGLLVKFGIGAFASVQTQPVLILSMIVSYLIGKRLFPRYVILGVLATGVTAAGLQQQLHIDVIELAWAQPQFTTPAFSFSAMLGLALPLFIVTMTSQNAAGVAALRSAGFDAPVSKPIGVTGVLTVLLAPFGAYALNLAAITAAIAMSNQSHPDPNRRYIAGVFAGVFYILTGLFGAAITSVFAAFPSAMITALAGLALLGTIGSNLALALKNDAEREPALIAFLITASGLSAFGIGSAFWGLVGGAVASWAAHVRRP